MTHIVGDVFHVDTYLVHKERSTCARHDKYTCVLSLGYVVYVRKGVSGNSSIYVLRNRD